VGPNAVVRESVILTDAYIEAGAVVERCILDKIVVVGHNARVGLYQDVGELGITCVGKDTHIPAGFTIAGLSPTAHISVIRGKSDLKGAAHKQPSIATAPLTTSRSIT
jgi:tetrahydrodipicolinate N-succinyltransferase